MHVCDIVPHVDHLSYFSLGTLAYNLYNDIWLQHSSPQSVHIKGMSRFLVLSALLAATLLGAIGHASPLDSDRTLHSRDNKWKLKCSNAPEVVAGK